MDELLIGAIILIIIGIVVIPIFTLIKVMSQRKKIDFLNLNLSELSSRLNKLLNSNNVSSDQFASKTDIAEVLDAVKQLTIEVKDLGVSVQNKGELSDEKLVEAHANLLTIEETIVVEDLALSSIIERDDYSHIGEEHSSEIDLNIKTEYDKPTNLSYSLPEKESEIYADLEEPHMIDGLDVKRSTEKSLIEKLLTENLLSKIGIVTLVLGIGFFVKYAIDKNWINEIGRVGIGLFTGGLLIAIAHKLKEKYDVFSSILVGGGISVFYITITLAFREYELFPQSVAFIILIVITLFSVILSLLYDRKELAIFSLLGGFASPLMISSGEGNYIILFSYILILNSGMLIIALRKKWHLVSIVSYVLTQLFFWIWLLSSFQNEYIGATFFSVLFFAQFYFLAVIDHFKEEYKITPFQAVLLLTNNLSVFLACVYILQNYSYDILGGVTISLAILNALVMFSLFKNKKVDRNLIYLVIGVVMTFVSLAIPIQLKGCAITMFWAAEMVVLLWLWQKSQIEIFRVGFFLISVLVLISFVMDVNFDYSWKNETLPIVFNRVFITGITLIVAVVLSNLLLKKENPYSKITFRNFTICNTQFIRRIFFASLVLVTFVVPFLEINYQAGVHFDTYYSVSFRYLALGVYTSLYMTVITIVQWKKQTYISFTFNSLSISVLLYAFVYSYLTVDLRSDIYISSQYPSSYFLIHFLGVPAVAIQIGYLIKNIKNRPTKLFSTFCWILAILSVVMLSVELDNVVILFVGNINNYDAVLYDIHTFGYPILWGMIALILMIWGLRGKEVVLRKISLSFFAAVILKFYAYDVWYMSQAGRIISFVILGLILLSVSFLQQKIKTLVKEDHEVEK